MTITHDEIRQLYAVAMAYDNRKVSEANITAWHEAATRARWTFPAALEAIHQHYTERTDFLMPGHITERIRHERTKPAAYQPAQLESAPPADDDTRERLMAIIDDTFAMPDPHSDSNTKPPELTVHCPWCHAKPGRPCTRTATNQQRVAISRYHDSRIDAAPEHAS